MMVASAACCYTFVLMLCIYFSSANNTSCPTFFYYSNTSHQCECGVSVGVQCNQQERKAEVDMYQCVTTAEQEGQYYVGGCPLAHTAMNHTNRVLSELPSDPDQLNDVMCGPYNRRGLLCGQCISGYGPGINHFNLKCANCSNIPTVLAVGLYLLVELVPSALFFICVIIFHINITAGPLLGYVLFCQAFTLYFQTHVSMYVYIVSHASSPVRVLFQISLTLSAFWNLSFLKPVIPPFCISEKLTDIHTLLLSFVAVIYPILLIAIICVLIELHARNYRLLHILWKPFKIILIKTNITAVNTNAVIHGFATFALVSSTANVYNLTVMMMTTYVHTSIDGKVYSIRLYSDPTISYLSQQYLLYLLLPVVSIFLVLVPSLLLCVYPTRVYTKLSQCVSARVRLAITAFAEALHCCFKDGLNGTRDYRASAGLVILLFPASSLVVSAVDIATGSIVTICTFFVASLLLSQIRPCKSAIANFSLAYHFTVLGILALARHIWDYEMSTRTDSLELTIIILPLISHILVFIWVGYTVSHYVMLQCGYSPRHERVLTRLRMIASHCFHRNRGGYQALPNMANA